MSYCNVFAFSRVCTCVGFGLLLQERVDGADGIQQVKKSCVTISFVHDTLAESFKMHASIFGIG